MRFLSSRFRHLRNRLSQWLLGPTILFEITSRCNQDCLFCYNVWKNSDPYPGGKLPTDKAKDCLGKVIRESATRSITITGGEPLLRNDLEEIVEYLHSKRVSVTLITNGILLDNERAKRLVKTGVDLFEITVLGVDRCVHNQLTQAESFDKCLDAAANIRAAGGHLALSFVGTKLNIDQWPEFIKLSLALGAEGVLFNRFNAGGEGTRHIDELMLSLEQVKDALRVADDAVKKYGMHIGLGVPIPECIVDHSAYPNLQFVGCMAGTSNAYWTIDPVGNVRPCNHSSTILGNVLNEPFSVITGCERSRTWAVEFPERCDGCEHLASCKGGCKAAGEVCDGSLKCLDPFVSRSLSNMEVLL
jgi:radical SAM protein with 4Fe4S-binding SPASM domain